MSAKGSSDYRDGDERSSRGSRDRVPESLRKEATSGSRGNYFAGQNPAETELANRREVKQKAAETDKISAGAGDRRRELEAMLSPEMRNNAAAAQRIRAEQIKEDADRRARASVARKFARPVEKVISLYNSQKTDLFDVLQVGKSANDATLKKAYRRLALMVHPGIYIIFSALPRGMEVDDIVNFSTPRQISVHQYNNNSFHVIFHQIKTSTLILRLLLMPSKRLSRRYLSL